MKIFKGKRIKLLFLSLIFVILIEIVSLICINNYYRSKNNEIVNEKIASIVLKVKDNYPDVDMEDIIDIVNSKEDNVDYSLFDKYGINLESEAIILKNDLVYKECTTIILLLIITTFLTIVLFLIRYFNLEKNSINEITKLLNDINNKIYKIDILEESEDNLSNLRSEVYKTSMMLKMESIDAREREKTLVTMIDNISHQLKTPLASISVMLSNMMDIDLPKDKRNEYLKKCENQILLINDLIMTLLQESLIDSGSVKTTKESINIRELISLVLDDLSINLELKNIEVSVSGNATFEGSLKWEREAIKNILKNAIDASFNGGNIDVSINETNFYTKLVIKDYGVGISLENRKHIFERFYKVNNSSNGFGIGLSLAKKIIDMDSGIISVKSNEKEGTSFIIKYMK